METMTKQLKVPPPKGRAISHRPFHKPLCAEACVSVCTWVRADVHNKPPWTREVGKIPPTHTSAREYETLGILISASMGRQEGRRGHVSYFG